mgnify:CR=1 FL=1
MTTSQDHEQSDGEVEHCDKCENPAQWTWHDGMWSGGRYCNDHIREKLKKDRKLAEYRDAITTEENVTKLRGETAIIPAGAKPLDSTFPVVRTKGALDQALNEDRELVTDGGQDADGVPRTDGGTTPQEVLNNNGVGSKSGYQGSGYAGTETAFEAIEQFAAEYVDDQMVISSRSLANAVTHEIRVQEIGKTLAAHLEGRTPDTFLTEVEVSKWSDAQPIKWSFVRIAGEIDKRPSRRLQKPALVREISAETGAAGARYRTVEKDGARWERAKMTVQWMRDVLDVVCAVTDYTPQAVAEDDELTRREWIDQLTQAATSEVLERASGIETPGAETSWNKSTVRAIHAVLVEGRSPGEVDA